MDMSENCKMFVNGFKKIVSENKDKLYSSVLPFFSLYRLLGGLFQLDRPPEDRKMGSSEKC